MPPARREIADASLRRPHWSQAASRDPRLLWLDKNENTDPVLQAVTARVLAGIDPVAVAMYPDVGPLYRKLADYLDVDARSLVLAAGSDEVIALVFRAFVAAGDRVLITHPTYAMYQVYCRIHGASTIRAEYRAGDAGPMLRADEIIKLIRSRGPKLVCLPNPDSPTGTVVEPEALRAIAETALEAGSMLFIDEAYHPFYARTVLPWIHELPNLIVARTFSKAWGLTGVRLGYGVSTIETAELLHKVRANYEVNSIAVAMAMRMLTQHEHDMRASVERLNRGRDVFVDAMRSLRLRTLAGEGSFCHVAFDAWSERVHAALSDIVIYRRDFDVPCLKGFSRFSSTTPELFAPVIERVRSVVQPARAASA